MFIKAINLSSDSSLAGKAWLSTLFPKEIWIGGWANRAQAANFAFAKGWISEEDRDRISVGMPPVGGWANVVRVEVVCEAAS